MLFRHSRPKNPIIWRGFLYQKRIAPLWLQRWDCVGVDIVVLLLGFILIITALVGPLGAEGYPVYPIREITQGVVRLIHVGTILRSIIAGVEIGSREYVDQTWESLALTGVSARQILLGQWYTALYRMRGWIVALGLIRLAIVPIFIASYGIARYGLTLHSLIICARVSNVTSCGQVYADPFKFVRWDMWAIPGATMTALFLTGLEVACCTALGIAAGTMLRHKGVGIVAASVCRLLPIVIFAMIPIDRSGYLFWRWGETNWFALADGGTTAIMRMILPGGILRAAGIAGRLYPLLGATLMLLAMLILSLSVALIALRRAGASPHSRS